MTALNGVATQFAFESTTPQSEVPITIVAAELLVLFRQKGFRCHLREANATDVQVLVFDAGADRAQAKDILEAYKNAKGS